MPDLQRTETAVEACRTHLADHAVEGSPIDAYLSRYLAIVLCAELEETIRALIHSRVQERSHPDVQSLVAQIGRNLVRSAEHKEIREVLGYFGAPFGERYLIEVMSRAQEQGIEALNNLVKARNDIAHRAPPNLTMAEIETALGAGKQVLAAVRVVLELE